MSMLYWRSRSVELSEEDELELVELVLERDGGGHTAPVVIDDDVDMLPDELLESPSAAQPAPPAPARRGSRRTSNCVRDAASTHQITLSIYSTPVLA